MRALQQVMDALTQAGEAAEAAVTPERFQTPPPSGEVVVERGIAALVRAGGAVVATVDGMPGMCGNCGGTGVILVRKLQGGPFRSPPNTAKATITWLDGPHAPRGEGWYVVQTETHPCPACQLGREGQQRYLRHLQASCGLTAMELRYRLDFLEALARRLQRPNLLDGKREALAAVGERLAALPKTTGMLFLFGPPGVGKSGMAKSLVASAVSMGVPAVYTTVPAYIQARRALMRDAHAADPAPRLQRAPLVVLDEVDRVGTEWEAGELYSLVDARTRERHRALTVMISNRTPGELRAAGFGYLVSRAMHGAMIAVGGDDLRPLLS